MASKSLYGMHTNPNYLFTRLVEGSPKVSLHGQFNLYCLFFLRKSITGTLLAIRELIKYTAQRLLCITFLFVFAVIGVGLQKKLQSQGVISEAAVRDGGKIWSAIFMMSQ